MQHVYFPFFGQFRVQNNDFHTAFIQQYGRDKALRKGNVTVAERILLCAAFLNLTGPHVIRADCHSDYHFPNITTQMHRWSTVRTLFVIYSPSIIVSILQLQDYSRFGTTEKYTPCCFAPTMY